MFQLRLFGSPVLERGDTALTGRAVQRHRLALLALLALAPGRRLSRDRLIAYLWPERDTTSGRNLLKVSTHVLRSELADDVLLSESDQIRLNDEVVRVDALEFSAALASLDHARAMALYDGPFLDGFFLDAAGEFEEWTSRERRRLAGEYASALEMLATAAEAAGDHATAADWWLKRAAHEPLSSRVALRLMQALQASGNVAGALRHAAIHETVLREELGIDTPAELLAAVERMRAHATRTTALRREPTPPDDEPSGDAAMAKSATVSAAVQPPATPPAVALTRRRRAPALAGLVALVLLVTVGAVYATRGRAAPAAPRSVAVLPFVNLSADPDNAYFGVGLTDQIIATLSRVQGLHVVARTSSFRLRDVQLDVRSIGDTLGVATVLEGSVRREGNRLRVTAQLIDAATGYHLWTEEYDRQPEDIIAVQVEIAAAIARALHLRLSPSPADAATPDLEAYDYYLRALYLRNAMRADELAQAAEFFDRAIERAPTFAPAYAGKAIVLASAVLYRFVPHVEGMTEMRELVDRALELDPMLAEAHTALGISRLYWDWDWEGAKRSLRRAVEMNPGDAHGYHQLANYYNAMGMDREAAATRARSVELDPLNACMLVFNAGDYARIGEYDRALELYRRAMKLDPVHPVLLGYGTGQPGGPGLVYAAQGRHHEAVEEYVRVATLRGATRAETEALPAAFERNGWPGFWRAWMEMDERQMRGRKDPVRTARLLLLAGDTAQALDWADRAHAERSPGLIFLERGLPSSFDGLSAHPRVVRIIDAMGLPRN